MPPHSLWVINHYASLPTAPDGTRHYELAKRLTAAGHDVTIIASQFHHKTRSRVELATRPYSAAMVDGVRFLWVPSRIHYRKNSVARMLNMLEFSVRVGWKGRRRFRQRLPRPNVILGSSPHPLAAFAAGFISKKLGARFILEIRDLWPETLVQLGGYEEGHPLVRILRRVERFQYKRAVHIVSLLPEAWKYLERCGVARDRVTWVPNGASVARDQQDPDRGISSSDELRVIYVGAHGRANVLDDLLSAAGILLHDGEPIRLILLGDGPEKPRLVARAQQEGLCNVQFRDSIPKAEVARVLSHADVGIALMEDSPLYDYGVSLNKLFDYFAAGLPVLLAGRIAHDYVALSGAGLTIPPRSPEAIAAGLLEMAQMPPEERLRMGRRGQEYLQEHHDWDLLADRLMKILEEVTEASR
ncbi:MAG TPA: glycosyltransferase WbuB [Candidatus Acetothermia bacterium]|nr:glycosyltransferase WbuB [Candidatus Acetothermia bacterium]